MNPLLAISIAFFALMYVLLCWIVPFITFRKFRPEFRKELTKDLIKQAHIAYAIGVTFILVMAYFICNP